jgi:hypothetical protein
MWESLLVARVCILASIALPQPLTALPATHLALLSVEPVCATQGSMTLEPQSARAVCIRVSTAPPQPLTAPPVWHPELS